MQVDQWGIFFIGALLGMVLPAILYMTFVAEGSDIRGSGDRGRAGAGDEPRGAACSPIVVAIMSVWILFKTQLDILEGTVRAMTDILWSGERARAGWRGGDVRFLYYAILVVIVLWGVFALSLTQPLVLLQIGANMAGVVLVLAPLHILRVNTTLLPEPIAPPALAAGGDRGRWRSSTDVRLAVAHGGLVPDPGRGFVFQLARALGS